MVLTAQLCVRKYPASITRDHSENLDGPERLPGRCYARCAA